MKSTMVFHSDKYQWSVWTCACGCDLTVQVQDFLFKQLPGEPRWYVRDHGPLAVDPMRVCPVWGGSEEEKFEDAPTRKINTVESGESKSESKGIRKTPRIDNWDEPTPITGSTEPWLPAESYELDDSDDLTESELNDLFRDLDGYDTGAT